MAELNTELMGEESVLVAVLLLAANTVRNAPPKPGHCQMSVASYSNERAAPQPAANKLPTSCLPLGGGRKLAKEREFIAQWGRLLSYSCSCSLSLLNLFYLIS